MAFEVDDVKRLYVKNENGACLEICPNPDAPDFGIVLHSPDKKSEEWFGKVNLILSPDECRTLGSALVEYADIFDKRNA